MGVNQLYFGNTKVFDISDSTVKATNLKSGEIAYNAAGNKITGTMAGGKITEIPSFTTQLVTAVNSSTSTVRQEGNGELFFSVTGLKSLTIDSMSAFTQSTAVATYKTYTCTLNFCNVSGTSLNSRSIPTSGVSIDETEMAQILSNTSITSVRIKVNIKAGTRAATTLNVIVKNVELTYS